MLNHLLVGTEAYATILSMFPGGEIYDVSKFLYDVAHYKKGDKAKIVADLVALGIDGAAAFADEIIDAAKIAKRVAAKRATKLSIEQINYYLNKAINNSPSKKVVLGITGKYDKIGEALDYTYFKMTQEIWDDLVVKALGNYDEVWKVNAKFLDEQIKAGKEIIMSNDPNLKYLFEDGTLRFYQREIDYLEACGFEFSQMTGGLWKAVKK
jgi:hypothetical protein